MGTQNTAAPLVSKCYRAGAAILANTGQYCAILDNTGQYWAILANTGQYCAILGNIGQYRAILADHCVVLQLAACVTPQKI